MPRVTSGSAKNKNLKVPDVPNIRAVQDVFKLALFSIIGDKIKGATCLDLYAGSGSIGIEALSRGAGWCDFVDEHKRAEEAINFNLKNCKLNKIAQFHRDNAVKYAANTEKKYDIIFLDPFYNDLKHKFLLQNLEEILNENGVIAFSHGKELNIEDQIKDTKLSIFTQRRFGKSHLTILQHTSS